MRSNEFKNCSKQKDLFMKTFSQEAEKNLYVNKEAPYSACLANFVVGEH